MNSLILSALRMHYVLHNVMALFRIKWNQLGRKNSTNESPFQSCFMLTYGGLL